MGFRPRRTTFAILLQISAVSTGAKEDTKESITFSGIQTQEYRTHVYVSDTLLIALQEGTLLDSSLCIIFAMLLQISVISTPKNSAVSTFGKEHQKENMSVTGIKPKNF